MRIRWGLALGVMGLAVSLTAAMGWCAEADSMSDEGSMTESSGQAAAEQVPASDAQTTLNVAEITIATGIENREPQGVANTFPADVGKLYCYTKIEGGKEGDEIVHKWMKGDATMAEVTLKVNGSPWRTYSSKSIMPEWTGSWSVEILQHGQVLTTKDFTIDAAASPSPAGEPTQEESTGEEPAQ